MTTPASGVELAEVAPGVDVERDILANMGFRPIVRGEPKPMDVRLFRPEAMGLEQILLGLSLTDRVSYDTTCNTHVRQFRRPAGAHAR